MRTIIERKHFICIYDIHEAKTINVLCSLAALKSTMSHLDGGRISNQSTGCLLDADVRCSLSVQDNGIALIS